MAETTGLLDQSLGPIIQTWQNLPPYAKVGVVAVGGALGLGYYWLDNRDDKDTLNATDWKEKWENFLKAPTEKTGGKINQPLYKRSTSARKRRIGNVKRIDETETYIGSSAIFESIADPKKKGKVSIDDLEFDKSDFSVKAVTYAVVEGDKKLDRLINTLFYKLGGIFSDGSNPQAEYYDLPLNTIKITDQGIVIRKWVHLFKKDGLWQTATTEGQNRLYQLSWLDTHQNWQESLQKHPEFYSDLNMDVSGKKNIMNQKSENMREYKKNEKLQDKGEAMEE